MLVMRTLSRPESSSGAVAIDNSGMLLAAEVPGDKVQISPVDNDMSIDAARASDSEIRAIALNTMAGLLAVSKAYGQVELCDANNCETCYTLTVCDQNIDAISFSPDGRLLAVGGEDGLIIVFLVSSGQELWCTEIEGPITAIAVNDLGSPVLTGDSQGFVLVHHRRNRTQCIPVTAAPVTSLAASASSAGEFLVGTANGVIGTIDTMDLLLSRSRQYRDSDERPVRALCAPERDKITALVGNDELTAWATPDNGQDDFDSIGGLIRVARRQLWGWTRELYVLITSFDEVRQLMGDEIAAERARMLDEIEGLDQETRERIHPVVVESATSIFETYSAGLAVRRILRANPLPALLGYVLATVSLGILAWHAANAISHLHSSGSMISAVAVTAIGLIAVAMLGHWGTIIRALRFLMLCVAAMAVLSGPRVSWPTTHWPRRFLASSFPIFRHIPERIIIPYPIWLGLADLVWIVVAVFILRTLTDYLLSLVISLVPEIGHGPCSPVAT